MIKKAEHINNVINIFPLKWRGDIVKFWRLDKKWYIPGLDINIFYKDEESACVTLTFDGVTTLFYLWTIPDARGKGNAQDLTRSIGEYFKPIPVIARYRNDEKDVEKLFKKAGYDIIHNGNDNFVIVSYRNI